MPAFGALILLLVALPCVGCGSLPSSRVLGAEAGSATATVAARATAVEAPDQPGTESPKTARAAHYTEGLAVAGDGPVAAARLDSPLGGAASAGFGFSPDGDPSRVLQSDLSRRVQLALDRFIDALFRMDGMTWCGWAIVVAVMFFYAVERRSPLFIFAFATAAWTGAVYGYLRGSWQVGVVGGIWGCLAVRKCWRDIKVENRGAEKPGRILAVWHIRFVGVLAVISAVVLLIVDAPIFGHLPPLISRAVIEAIPLLLVGIAYLSWLAVDRPSAIDVVKQGLIAIAFILWGTTLLMPTGQWSRFMGAIVIALYVFDLAWLMEGNLRKTIRASRGAGECTSADCASAGVCRCNGVLANAATARMVKGEPRASAASTRQ